MKKIMMTFAAVLCCAMTTTVVNAQEAESPIKEGERLAKAADDAPQDWKKQYDAAKFYLNESNGTPDPKVAEKYANRALEIAQSQTEKRDTILGKSFELMSTLGMYNKNADQMIGCYDQAIRAYVDELGYENAAIPEALNLNDQLPEGQKAEGMQDALTIYAISYETLMAKQKQLMKDKVWLWTDQADGKTYTILACHDWTVEQPDGFWATMLYDSQSGKKKSDFKHGLVLMDEQGNITERKNSEFVWNVKFLQEGISYRLTDDTTLRLVSISSEKRQQIINALHKFENK